MLSFLYKALGLGSWSLRGKVNITVGVSFMLVIALVTTYNARRENARLTQFAEEQTKDLTTFYFDSLNTMMLTGTMDQRTILRKKVLARPGVVEARVVRGEPVKQQFGPGNPDEQPVDELDRRALAGEDISLIETRDGKRVWTVLTPFRATENTRNVNCLQCHHVPAGAINGAVRISYSLAATDAAVNQEMWVSIIANIFFLATGLLLVNTVLRNWVTNPLTQLMKVVNRRAAGEENARADVLSRDEVGQLAEAFNTMAENIAVSARREHEATEDLRSKVARLLEVINRVTEGHYDVQVGFNGEGAIGELAGNLQIMITYIRNSIEEKREAVEKLRREVDQILDVVTRAANGDLTGRLTIESQDAIGQLAHGVQRMIDSLNMLVSQVQHSGIQVATSTTEIAATSKQQEATVAEQAATTTEIVTTATEISATSRELEKTMQEVANISEQTAQSATRGHDGLTRMQATMKQIVDASGSIAAKLEILSEKAGNIGSVVTTINKVADQTNLLSLNAAIEAEKAGEYGFGFAVVAREIRRLADQTAVATLDIEQIVREMQSAVSAGVMSMEKFSDQVRRSVEDVTQVSQLLSRIIDQVQELTPRFESVHQSMHLQAQGAQHIHQTMMVLNESAQHTADSIRQSNAAIERLNDAAHSLQDGVTRFKVRR
jgi:methyl-accepting chemotaxis protein